MTGHLIAIAIVLFVVLIAIGIERKLRDPKYAPPTHTWHLFGDTDVYANGSGQIVARVYPNGDTTWTASGIGPGGRSSPFLSRELAKQAVERAFA